MNRKTKSFSVMICAILALKFELLKINWISNLSIYKKVSKMQNFWIFFYSVRHWNVKQGEIAFICLHSVADITKLHVGKFSRY